jgi:hypothetical protein
VLGADTGAYSAYDQRRGRGGEHECSSARLGNGRADLETVEALVCSDRELYGVNYDFNAPFTIISEGAGAFGDGLLSALPGILYFPGPLSGEAKVRVLLDPF